MLESCIENEGLSVLVKNRISDFETQYMVAFEECLRNGYEQFNERTGKGVRRLEHVVFTLDLSKGLPVPTAKKLFMKSAIDEILWIMQRQSNNTNDLNSKIWDSWAEEETSNNLVKVEKKTKPIPKGYPHDLPVIIVGDLLDSQYPILYNNNKEAYRVLSYYDSGKRAKIQFLNTGYISDVAYSSAYLGEVKDLYSRTVNGLGYYGDYKAEDILDFFGEQHKRWVNTWQNMIRRCSDVYNVGDWYDDIFVDESFQCCANFLRWVMQNLRYSSDKLDILQIDKDYYGANYYGEDSCTIVTPEENTALTLDTWYIYKNSRLFFSKRKFAEFCIKELNIPNMHMPSGKISTYRMDTIVKDFIKEGLLEEVSTTNEDSSLTRFNLEVVHSIGNSYGWVIKEYSQIDKLLHDIKNDPSSRRMVLNLWDLPNLEKMGLQPCCYTSVLDVVDGKLNCMLTQRSGDCCLGVPFNTFQYAVLTSLIAKSCGLEVGKLTHTIADFHIYSDQFKEAELQLARYKVLESVKRGEVIDFETLKTNGVLTEDMTREYLENIVNSKPVLVLGDNSSATIDFYDWELDKNIKIEGYNSLPAIKFEVAI